MSHSFRYSAAGVAALVGCFCASAYPAEFETPHRIAAGDVISADVINEVLQYIDNSKIVVTKDSLLGTWTCVAYATPSDGAISGWTLVSNLYYRLDNATITFSNSGGVYSFSTSSPRLFPIYSSPETKATQATAMTSSSYDVIGSKFLYRYDTDGATVVYSILRISDSRMQFAAESSIIFMSATCDKDISTPSIPGRLSATTSGLSVGLTWTASSTPGDSYKIYRKTPGDTAWEEIASVSASLTFYTDSMSSAGSFLYRVKASNTSGESFGTNVIKVTVK